MPSSALTRSHLPLSCSVRLCCCRSHAPPAPAQASRILTRWENHITVPFSQRALVMWSIVLLFMLHWFSCIWAMAAVIAGSLRSSRLTAHLLATGASAECLGTSDCASADDRTRTLCNLHCRC